MKTADSPIFIVGSARSGTSLVYSILLASNTFAIYLAETLLLRTCAARYRSLAKRANYQAFINDWLRSKQFTRSGLEKEFFLQQLARRNITNYLEFLDFFMSLVTGSQGKRRWAENTPNHVLEMQAIAEYFPTSKFVHVIRDGRAVASSLAHLGWASFKHPHFKLMSAGLHWQRQVLAGRREGKYLGDRYLEVHYERLVDEPEHTLNRISTFVGTDITMKMLAENPYGTLRKSNSVYGDQQQSDRIFSVEALSRWKSVLSDDEQIMLNSGIGKTLQTFDYKVESGESSYWLASMFCSFVYNAKELLRNKTNLGRFTRTGLEINERKP